MFKLFAVLAVALTVLGITLPAQPAMAQNAEPTPPADAAPAAPIAAPPPAKATLQAQHFARDAFMSSPTVSPNGEKLAWIEGDGLVIFNVADETEQTLDGGTSGYASVDWINNDFLAVSSESLQLNLGFMVVNFGHSPIVVTKDAKIVRNLFDTEKGKPSPSGNEPIIRFIDGPAPYAITIDGDRTNLIDVATGKRKPGPKLLKGEGHFFDRNGVERLAVDTGNSKISYGVTKVTFRYRDAAGKVQTLQLPSRESESIYYINFNFSAAENAIYWTEFNYLTGLCSIYSFDIDTGARSLFRSGPNKDMDLAFDEDGRIVGITTFTDRLHTEWLDPYHLKMDAAVQALFPTATVDIVDMTRDRQDIVFLISAPEAPDAYYQYSTTTKELVWLGGNYPELDEQPLGEMTYITYKARDGLDIPAYVTKRKDTPQGAPLIVMPHGGPAARDYYGFDFMAQYLASKGYVVLQPQYRGSAGFGDAFERAGNKHLAQMNTDLEDGVRYLQAQGMIDPKKVCVVGWSWGGYLAQAALAFTPDTYVCGVSGAGISDLFEALKEERNSYWGGHSIDYWRGIIGKKGPDSDMIRATSPIEHIDAIKAPLLLIHGEFDPTVSVKQSERMNAAMTKAGKAVTYVPITFMGHSPGSSAQRTLMLTTMDDFIAKAFGTYVAPVAPVAPTPVAKTEQPVS